MLSVDFWEGIKQGAKGEAWQVARMEEEPLLAAGSFIGTSSCLALLYPILLVKCNAAGLNYENHHLSGPPVYPAGAMQWCEDLT